MSYVVSTDEEYADTLAKIKAAKAYAEQRAAEQPVKPVASTVVTEPADRARREAEAREFAEAARSTVEQPEARYGHPLSREARLSGLPEVNSRPLTEFGEYVRSLAGYAVAPEARAAVEGTNSAGGFLVPVQYASPILDLAINQSAVRAAGARVIPMNSQTMNVPFVVSDPVPAFRNESAAIAESDPVFDRKTFTARSLAVHVKVSRELLEDSEPSFGEVLAVQMARQFALKLDEIALYGSGVAPQPLGIKGTAGVNTVNFTGANGGTLAAATAYATGGVGGAVSRLRGKNYNPTGMIMSPRTEAQLGLLVDTTGQPLTMPEYVSRVPRYATGNVPNNLTLGTSTDVSDLIVGDFGWLGIGMRTEFGMSLNPYALELSAGQVAFVGWMRFDVQVLRPAAFEILTGLRA